MSVPSQSRSPRSGRTPTPASPEVARPRSRVRAPAPPRDPAPVIVAAGTRANRSPGESRSATSRAPPAARACRWSRPRDRRGWRRVRQLYLNDPEPLARDQSQCATDVVGSRRERHKDWIDATDNPDSLALALDVRERIDERAYARVVTHLREAGERAIGRWQRRLLGAQQQTFQRLGVQCQRIAVSGRRAE